VTARVPDVYFSVAVYTDFHAVERWSNKDVHCLYQSLILAISTRHADAVDIKFLAGGRAAWIALPLRAWVEYKARTGKEINDPLAIEVAGRYLKTAIEAGEDGGREFHALSVEETLAHLDALRREAGAAAAP
jgi:hypothetical protein